MAGATIRQAVILACGSDDGRAAGAAAGPLPLLPCGDRPFLAWQLRELIRFGVSEFVILAGDSVAAFEKAVGEMRDRLPKRVAIAISRAPPDVGTAGALLAARDRLDDDFLLCAGSSLFDGNLGTLLCEAAASRDEELGRLLVRHGGSGPEPAGISVLQRRILAAVPPAGSLERDVLPELAARAQLGRSLVEGCFLDLVAPADLVRARKELPRRLRRPALFLDRDGVINVDHRYVATRDRFDWVEGAIAALREATASGWHMFVVTNQSGVARGLYDEAMVVALHDWMADEVRRAGGTIDDIRYCPFHAEGTVAAYRRESDWRKPEPGMILDLIAAWELDPGRCVLVGDQPRDVAAAANAGIAGRIFAGGNLAEFIAPILRGGAAAAAR